MSLLLRDYVDKVYVINLPKRVDRKAQILGELSRLGFSRYDPKVLFPHAPIVGEPGGFPSPGVRGNFMSHLSILKDAAGAGYDVILVLEDDAIFRSTVYEKDAQVELVRILSDEPWDMFFPGHALTTELEHERKGVIRTTMPFKWSHCYMVHKPILDTLIAYLEETMANPAGHPRGGKMYIDGALSMFRGLYPDALVLISNPVLSVQRGSHSSLAGERWHERHTVPRFIVSMLRSARDELWRRGIIDITP
jgi:glycosyl transferase, family 25